MATKSTQTTWDVLSSIDCNGHTEVKNGLTYLSWAWAWGIVKANFPDANYSVREWEGFPYLVDERLGILVETSVTIQGETIGMRLPVMDGSHNAMKIESYSYKVKEYKGGRWTGGFIDKEVCPATMFDINAAIMRCLTKNLAMFGLGHYIYAGEDLPKELNLERQERNAKDEKERIDSLLAQAMCDVDSASTLDELTKVWNAYGELKNVKLFKDAVADKGTALKK